MSGFERNDGLLTCGGVSLEDAAAQFGTPLYLYSRGAIAAAYRAYQEALAPVPHEICYAVKANGSGGILRVLQSLGAGADVVSGFELEAALRAGFGPERIVFSGAGKTAAELSLALTRQVGVFNAESEQEIVHLAAEATALGTRAPVCLRVNPDIDPRSHPYISTGLRENKFGVDIAQALEILHRCRALPGVEIVGVQSHIGSQVTDLGPVEEAARELGQLCRRLQAEGLPLRLVDIGGGLGVDYDGLGAAGPADLAEAALPHLQDLGLTVVVEPGRSLVATAGVLLTRVLYVKHNRAKTFVIVDAGMNDLVRPSLYHAYHRIEPVLSRARGPLKADVVGPVCETGDFLARDREIEHVEPGELLAVRDAGAYGFSMASNYNMRPRAAEVLVEDGRVRLIRRRETLDDLLATEVPDPQ